MQRLVQALLGGELAGLRKVVVKLVVPKLLDAGSCIAILPFDTGGVDKLGRRVLDPSYLMKGPSDVRIFAVEREDNFIGIFLFFSAVRLWL